MATSGTVPIRDVWKMLKECAAGHVVKPTDHFYRVTYNGRTYPALPRKKGGKEEIEAGHLRQMVRQFEIEECAARQIPRLGIKKKPPGPPSTPA